MALSADQRAMLELLLGRGQSYEDLASLLDLPEAQVRARAREALTELAGADPDRNVGLTDYLLGQADPIGRADAARHLKEDPEDHRMASVLSASLQMIVPSAQLPKLPAEPGGGRRRRRAGADAPAAPASEPAASTSSRPGSTGPSVSDRLSGLTTGQNRLIVVLGSGAVILIAIVLAVTGAFGGGEDGDSTATATSTTAATGDEDIQQIPLEAAKGSDATGTATFGIADGSQPFVDLDISNLGPAPKGKAYVLWLLLSDEQGHPLQPFQANQDGTFSERIPIQPFLTELAARTQVVDVSLSEQKPLLKEVNAAVSGDQPTPVIAYTGETILRGTVQQTGAGGTG